MSLQLNFEDFLKSIEQRQNTKKSAEIRLDLNRLAPQKGDKHQNINFNVHNNNRKRKRKRSRKVWENQELKEELERKKAEKHNNNIQLQDDNAIRAKTRVYLHKILFNKFNELNNINIDNQHRNAKKRKLSDNNVNSNSNSNGDDELNNLCNEIENEIFMKCDENINKNYMEHSRNLLFNLKKNSLLQSKLIQKDIDGKKLVRMSYTELASEQLANKRQVNKKKTLEKQNSTPNEKNNNWIECNTVQCSNCGAKKCKYKPKKALLFETTKSVVFGSVSSKQENVDMICTKCSYSFKYEISFN